MASSLNYILGDGEEIPKLSYKAFNHKSVLVRLLDGSIGLCFHNEEGAKQAHQILLLYDLTNSSLEKLQNHFKKNIRLMGHYRVALTFQDVVVFQIPKKFAENEAAMFSYIWIMLKVITRINQLFDECENVKGTELEIKNAKIIGLRHFLREIVNSKATKSILEIIHEMESNKKFCLYEQRWLETTWLGRLISFFWTNKCSRTQVMFNEVKHELSKLHP